MHSGGTGQINRESRLHFFSRYQNQEVATDTKTTDYGLMNPQLNKAASQENAAVSP